MPVARPPVGYSTRSGLRHAVAPDIPLALRPLGRCCPLASGPQGLLARRLLRRMVYSPATHPTSDSEAGTKHLIRKFLPCVLGLMVAVALNPTQAASGAALTGSRTCADFVTGDGYRRLSVCARGYVDGFTTRGVVEMHTYARSLDMTAGMTRGRNRSPLTRPSSTPTPATSAREEDLA